SRFEPARAKPGRCCASHSRAGTLLQKCVETTHCEQTLAGACLQAIKTRSVFIPTASVAHDSSDCGCVTIVPTLLRGNAPDDRSCGQCAAFTNGVCLWADAGRRRSAKSRGSHAGAWERSASFKFYVGNYSGSSFGCWPGLAGSLLWEASLPGRRDDPWPPNKNYSPPSWLASPVWVCM